MLEVKIAELTAAVEALTKAIGGMNAPYVDAKFSGPVTMAEDRQLLAYVAGQDSIVHELKGAPLATASIKVEDLPNEFSPTTTSTSQTSAEESKPVAYSDVAKLVTQIAKTDLPKAKAALARLGVKHGKELLEADWPRAVEYLTRVSNGLDPEASHE
jgi:hypothetical protein